MLYTNLNHLETSSDLITTIGENVLVLVVCGKMGSQCVPVYRIAESLEKEYPEVRFCDMEFDNPESFVVRDLPEVKNFQCTPFTIYYRSGVAVMVTSGIQTREQITGNINELFYKTEKV